MTTSKEELDKYQDRLFTALCIGRTRHNSFPGGIWAGLASERDSTLLWQCLEENNLHFCGEFLSCKEPYILGHGLQ